MFSVIIISGYNNKLNMVTNNKVVVVQTSKVTLNKVMLVQYFLI